MIALSKLSETATTITLGWSPVPGARSYRLTSEKQSKATFAGPNATQAKFSKGSAWYKVEALELMDEGIYPPPQASNLRGVGRYRLNEGAILSHIGEYDVRVVGWQGDPTSAGTPTGMALTYMSALTCSSNAVSNPATDFHYGMWNAQATANNWVLTDGSGLITNSQYGGYLTDPGLTACNLQLCQNIEARLAYIGADGVFFDDCLRTVVHLSGGRTPTKYPTQAQWEAAMLTRCAYAYNYFHTRGYKVGFNAGAYTGGDGRSDTGELDRLWWTALAPHADVLSCEFWQWHSSIGGIRLRGGNWNQNWDGWQQLVPLATSLGVIGTYCTYTTNPAHAQYVAASMLLETDRAHHVFIHEPGGNGITPVPDPWGPLQDKLGALGAPLGPKVANGNRVERPFAGGLVWVDPVAGTSGIP